MHGERGPESGSYEVVGLCVPDAQRKGKKKGKKKESPEHSLSWHKGDEEVVTPEGVWLKLKGANGGAENSFQSWKNKLGAVQQKGGSGKKEHCPSPYHLPAWWGERGGCRREPGFLRSPYRVKGDLSTPVRLQLRGRVTRFPDRDKMC